jgi:pimeloyl-ACP methyl ester carboxylesterase
MENTVYHPFRSAKAKERFLASYDIRAKKWPVVSETRTVNTSYGKTFVRISGSDDALPLVLLHGAGGNSLQWLPNIKALSETYRVYAVDNIYDNGRSVYTRSLKTPYEFVDWLNELFDALELEGHINIVGVSYGGWLAVEYALHFPSRLDKIVLLAPASTVLPISFKFIVRVIPCILPFRYFTKRFMYWLMEDLSRKDAVSRMMLEEEIEFVFMATRCFKLKSMVHPTVLKDNELHGIKVPVLYLVGENEKLYSSKSAVQRLNTVAPNIKAEIIPNAGHDLTVVQADLVNNMVIEFLKQK